MERYKEILVDTCKDDKTKPQVAVKTKQNNTKQNLNYTNNQQIRNCRGTGSNCLSHVLHTSTMNRRGMTRGPQVPSEVRNEPLLQIDIIN